MKGSELPLKADFADWTNSQSLMQKTWLHQACSNRGNNVTMVSPVAIPEVVSRLLKSLSKQGGIKIKHARLNIKDFFYWPNQGSGSNF